MKGHTNCRAYIGLSVLCLGLLCTVLAVSTVHWYEYKFAMDSAILSMRSEVYSGLWQMCSSVSFLNVHKTKCFNVWESDKLAQYQTSGAGLANSDLGLGDLLGSDTRRRKRSPSNDPEDSPGSPDDQETSTPTTTTEIVPFWNKTWDERVAAYRKWQAEHARKSVDDAWDAMFPESTSTTTRTDTGSTTTSIWDWWNPDTPESTTPETKTDGENPFKNLDLGDILGDKDGDMYLKFPTKIPSVDDSDTDGFVADAMKQTLYPDYLKGVQTLEVVALFGGVAVVVTWVVFVVLSVRGAGGTGNRGSVRTAKILKFVAIGFTIATAVCHLLGVVLWVAKKQHEKSLFNMMNMLGQNQSFTANCGWSWGMAVVSTILHLLAIVPLALTKTGTAEDGMAHSLSPWTRMA